MEIWIVEIAFQNPRADMNIAACSSRDLAIQWIKDFGKDWLDAPTNRFGVCRMILDGGKYSLPSEENEYFNPDGTPWVFDEE